MTSILKETLISSIINALFSIAIFVALFHNESELILGGTSALTMDFLPQTFFVGLFAALPPSLLTLSWKFMECLKRRRRDPKQLKSGL